MHATLLLVSLCACVAHAQVVEVAPGDDLEAAINTLGPADELLLAGGTYELSDRVSVSIVGTGDAGLAADASDVPDGDGCSCRVVVARPTAPPPDGHLAPLAVVGVLRARSRSPPQGAWP